MTTDALILDALRVTPLTAAPQDTGPDFTMWSVLMDALRFPDVLPRSYKHILAPRGTPPRPHSPRATRRFRFCNN